MQQHVPDATTDGDEDGADEVRDLLRGSGIWAPGPPKGSPQPDESAIAQIVDEFTGSPSSGHRRPHQQASPSPSSDAGADRGWGTAWSDSDPVVCIRAARFMWLLRSAVRRGLVQLGGDEREDGDEDGDKDKARGRKRGPCSTGGIGGRVWRRRRPLLAFALVIVSALVLMIAPLAPGAHWFPGACEAQHAMAALCGVLLLVAPSATALAALVGACHVVVCAVVIGSGIAAGAWVMVALAVAQAPGGGVLFVGTVAGMLSPLARRLARRSGSSRRLRRSGSDEPDQDDDPDPVGAAWAITHAVAIFVVVAAVCRFRRPPFCTFVALAACLPVATACTPWTIRSGALVRAARVLLALCALVSIGGQVAYGFVVFAVDAARGAYGPVASGAFIFGCLRSVFIIWVSVVLCLPHAMKPFVASSWRSRCINSLLLWTL
jgi:hypothetical protein